MNIDNLIFFSFIVIGLASNLFYDPDKARTWVLKRLSNTPLSQMNKPMRLGLELILIIPTYLTWLLKFGVAGLIFFKAYDIIGEGKTMILLGLVIYITLLGQSNKKI